MGFAHGRRFFDLWMLEQHIVDLSRIDVIAPDDHHFLLAIDDKKIVVFVEIAYSPVYSQTVADPVVHFLLVVSGSRV